MLLRLFLALAVLSSAPPQGSPQPGPATTVLVARLEEALRAADLKAIVTLANSESAVADFAEITSEGRPTRVVVKERDRTQTPSGQRLLLEVFTEYGGEARLSTWNIETEPETANVRITSATRLASVSGLYRLSLTTAKQYDIRNLTVTAPDLALQIGKGTAFIAQTPDGPTAVVLLGEGEMRFTPKDPAERTQVRIFSGQEAMKTPFDAAFVRVRPSDFASRFPEGSLVERPASEGDLRRAQAVFEEYVGKTLQIELRDLSNERWWITPQAGDLIAEIRTKHLGSLTYTRSGGDSEDISLFERRRRRNISVYASAEKLARRGRFYSEDDLLDYDVLAYDIDAAISPERLSMEGNARLKIKIRSAAVSSINLRLADSLIVKGVFSPNLGRLLHLRVIGQNSVIVNLPTTASLGTELWLNDPVLGPRATTGARPRSDFPIPGGPGFSDVAGRTSLPLQPARLLVSAVASQRLRDHAFECHRARGLRHRRERSIGRSAGSTARRCRWPGAAPDVRVRKRPAGAVPGVRGHQAAAGRDAPGGRRVTDHGGERATDRARQEHGRPRRRHLQLLPLSGRHRPLPVIQHRRHRTRNPGRTQSRLLRGGRPGAAHGGE